jgi:diguanylate cyclase (GGDEF)-like protein
MEGDSSNAPASDVQTFNIFELNASFNKFLRIDEADKQILEFYCYLLLEGDERFAHLFYDYLLAFPATSKILKQYQEDTGALDKLVQKQLQHLRNLLSGDTSDASAQVLAHIGQVHHIHNIEPVWLMGAYQLYLDHLKALIKANKAILEADRMTLENAISKFLFRDIGLMLQGYWCAATQQLQAETDKASVLQGQITSLLANIPQILWSIDVKSNQPLYISPVSREVCNMDIEMPIPCMNWTHPDDRGHVRLAWEKALSGQQVEVESRVRDADGEERWFRRVFHPYKDTLGNVVRVDGIMDETTIIKQTIERLNVLATTDSLTGLPNRALLYDRLHQAIAAAKRDDKRQTVLMMMDLDHFKEINDTLGHPAGDEVLRQVATRLRRLLRDSDTLARLGGDEFAVLLPDVLDAKKAAKNIAKNILASFSEPFWFGEHELFLGVGIGIALYPGHGDNVDALMKRADVAMYSAKHKDQAFQFYNPRSDPNTQNRLQLGSELRHALEREELVLHYQPKIDLNTGRIYGVEALIRWNHPEHGLIYPDQFIIHAERCGLISPITNWVIQTALDQCQDWNKQGIDLSVAVNISAPAFQNPNLVDHLHEVLKQNGSCIMAGRFEIEITENILMADIEHGSRVVKQISDLGATVSIDDFGTGYSSLAYLKKLPINSIKVDKSFVLNMADDENDAIIVRSTIDLAHNLGHNVVAEGVENRQTLDMLKELGCDNAQGYYMSRSLPASELTTWLSASLWGMKPGKK